MAPIVDYGGVGTWDLEEPGGVGVEVVEEGAARLEAVGYGGAEVLG